MNGTIFKVYIWDFLKRSLFFVHKMQLLLQGRFHYKIKVVEKLAETQDAFKSLQTKLLWYQFTQILTTFYYVIYQFYFLQIMWNSLCDHFRRGKRSRSSSQQPLWVQRSRKHQLFWWKQIIGRVQVSKAMYLISVRENFGFCPSGPRVYLSLRYAVKVYWQ